MRRMRKWLAAAGIGCLLGMAAFQTALADEPGPGGGGHRVNAEQGPAGQGSAEQGPAGQGPGFARQADENGNGNGNENGNAAVPSAQAPQEGTQGIGPGFAAETVPGAPQGQESAAEAGSNAPQGQGDAAGVGPGFAAKAAQETENGPGAPRGPGSAAEGTAAEGQPETQEEDSSSGRTVDPGRPMVALTFDDGPETTVGNQIMDCLAAYGGKATFFLVGSRCPSRAAELQRMVAEGHEVANHSYDHKYFNKLSGSQIQNEVNAANDAIEAACGVRPALVRLPGGNINDTVRANVAFPMIMWSIDTLDWKTRNTQNTVNVVLGQVQDGDIVLMHELYGATGAAALQIIPELTARGYQLVTVSEMAQARGVTLEAGKTYSRFRP